MADCPISSDDIPLTMLKEMERGRIFSIRRCEGGFSIDDECDGSFQVPMTPEDLKQLGLEIIAMADSTHD